MVHSTSGLIKKTFWGNFIARLLFPTTMSEDKRLQLMIKKVELVWSRVFKQSANDNVVAFYCWKYENRYYCECKEGPQHPFLVSLFFLAFYVPSLSRVARHRSVTALPKNVAGDAKSASEGV